MLKRFFVLLIFLGVTLAMLPISAAVADEACVIPETGPWPPCATGGAAQPPASAGECVIPESGPWPPCATGSGGSSAPASPPSNGAECVIPESGPWPPCATGEGGGSTTATPKPTPDAPQPAPTPTPVDGSAPHPRFGRIVSTQVMSKDTYEVFVQVEVEGIEAGSWPLFLFYDPDNCFEQCHKPDEVNSYKISGGGTLPEGETSGVFTTKIHADRLLCPYQPETKRIVVAVTDLNEAIENFTNGRPIVYEIIHQFPLEHRWCQ